MKDKQYKAHIYLSGLQIIDRRIREKEKELWDIGAAKAIRYDKISVQTSPADPMEKVSDIIAEIQEEKERYIRIRHEMISEIYSIKDNVYEEYLWDRYVEGLSVKQMRDKYSQRIKEKDIDISTVYRTLNRALGAFAETHANKCK